MITLLVVGATDLGAAGQSPPSVELLRAATPDAALEALSRNRRIDAVLFADEETAKQTARLLAEEGSFWPPLFRAGPTSVPGVVALEPESPLDGLLEHLGE